TNAIEQSAFDYIKRIDEMGGAVKAIECGFVEQEIQDSAYRFQKAVESGEQVIVGVNRFQVEEQIPYKLLKVDPAVRETQIKRLETTRAERDSNAVNSALARVRKAAEGTENLMPPIVEAVKERASLGEICGVLREVFGEYTHASQC
ncbi:MAG: methylmalonyl-CoA mutase, partial [Deltaproteobacteria bacterium]|nr:methylmalonyl-CoA mutase [Deltaproteobacteria bacterium]